MKKADIYKNKSVKDLTELAKKLRHEIAKSFLEAGTSGQKDTNSMHKKRKSLAVVLSLITKTTEIEKLKSEIK